jgi:hypothetical protein
LSRARLEGWQQAPRLFPSFETAARLCERPPQDDVCVCCANAVSPDFALRAHPGYSAGAHW